MVLSNSHIHNLPAEILSMIMGCFKSKETLLRCALVHTSWTSPALRQYYDEIEISKPLHLVEITLWAIQYRFATTTVLAITGSSMRWSADLDLILRECTCLKQLHLGALLSGKPLNMLHYPSLQNLRILHAMGTFQPASTASEQCLTTQPAVPS